MEFVSINYFFIIVTPKQIFSFLNNILLKQIIVLYMNYRFIVRIIFYLITKYLLGIFFYKNFISPNIFYSLLCITR